MATYCPNCRVRIESMPLSSYRRTIQSGSRYIEPGYTPRPTVTGNVRLIHHMAVKRRNPIYKASPAAYERLNSYVIAKSGRYLAYAIFAFVIGLLVVLLTLSAMGVASLFIPAFIAALVPIAVYLYWIRSNDRYEPEPTWLIALAFGWGAFSTLPAIILNQLFAPLFGGWAGYAAFVEEPLKMLGVYFIATSRWLSGELNDHLDGLIYGVAAGLGFSLMENILYIARGLAAGSILIVFIRMITAAMHMFCTGLVGWWMGYLKVNGLRVTLGKVVPALFYAMLIHMTWNTIGMLGFLSFLLIPWGLTLAYYTNKMAKEALIDEYYWGFATGYAPDERLIPQQYRYT